MSVRAAFYQPGATTPYAQLYRPTSQPPEGVPVIMGGTLMKVRPNLPDTGTLVLSAPLAFTPGDWVRVWLEPELPEPDYLGQIVSEPWADGSGEVQMRSIMERVKACRWIGKAEGDYQAFFGAVLSLSKLPPGVTPAPLPAINARFAADTPHELLGDTIQAIIPALGGYQIGVDVRGQLATVQPNRNVTHRFMLGQSEMPQGDMTNYANCVRFSFELPSGDTGWFEGRNEPEVAAQGEVWTVEQLTAREVGLPEEPLNGASGQVIQSVMFPGLPELLISREHTVLLHDLSPGVLPIEQRVTLRPSTPGGDSYQDEGGYVLPNPNDVPAGTTLPSDSSGAYYWPDAPEPVKQNARTDATLALPARFGLDVTRITQKARDAGQSAGVFAGLPAQDLATNLTLKVKLTLTAATDFPAEEALMMSYKLGNETSYASLSPVVRSVAGQGISSTGPGWVPVPDVPSTYEFYIHYPFWNEGTGGIVHADEVIIGYTPPYREHLRRKGYGTPQKPIQAIHLCVGGAVGVLWRPGTANEWSYFESLPLGTDTTQVRERLAVYDASGTRLTGERFDWLPLPALSDAKPQAAEDYLTARAVVANSVAVQLPTPVTLPPGSAVQVALPDGATLTELLTLPDAATESEMTRLNTDRPRLPPAEQMYLAAVSADPKLGRVLPRSEKEVEGRASFAVRGEEVTVQRFILRGVNALTGGLSVQTPQLDNVQTYAAELLRYRSQPVRDWRGFYSTLKRLEADGTAAFEHPHSPDDELLDVQRVTYNLTDWTAEVQAGTPLPATDEDAVAGVIESVRRVQRRAGGTT